jgi:ABC-type polar amino acid transport system ATPase subunit
VIEFRNVSKSFDKNVVLNDISLKIDKNEIVSILGTSGAGKSTLINCVNGLVEPDDGDVLVDGLSVSNKNELNEVRKKCSTVFQNFNLYPHLSILQNITLAPMKVLKYKRDRAENEAIALLEKVDLKDHANAFPSSLSGGEKQRVGICRALAMSPDYLLLDEVTSSLDPELTAEIMQVLGRLADEGSTMVLVTHEIGFAKKISTRIVFLESGKILADEPKDKFFSAEFGEENGRIRGFLARSEGL